MRLSLDPRARAVCSTPNDEVHLSRIRSKSRYHTNQRAEKRKARINLRTFILYLVHPGIEYQIDLVAITARFTGIAVDEYAS